MLRKKTVYPSIPSCTSSKMSYAKCATTVTSKRARYQTLLKCLQGTASCCLTLIRMLVHRLGIIEDVEMARKRISFLREDQVSFNWFYTNLMANFKENNIPQVIELLVVTNIALSSLEDDVNPPYADGNYVNEPLFMLYKFLLRIADERPILVITPDDSRGTHTSHMQEQLENFISELLHLKKVVFAPEQKK